MRIEGLGRHAAFHFRGPGRGSRPVLPLHPPDLPLNLRVHRDVQLRLPGTKSEEGRNGRFALRLKRVGRAHRRRQRAHSRPPAGAARGAAACPQPIQYDPFDIEIERKKPPALLDLELPALEPGIHELTFVQPVVLRDGKQVLLSRNTAPRAVSRSAAAIANT